MLTNILLGITIFLLILIIYLIIRGKNIDEVEVRSAILSAWQEADLGRKIGKISQYAEDIRKDHKDIEQMLKIPKERGAFGEISLEAILNDHLPPDMYGIRKQVLDGKNPDAYIESVKGKICIDSKFPLDNYNKMVEAEDKEKEKFKKKFIKGVKNQLSKISRDYVCPGKGSTDFAFAYIPSERVYYFLIEEAHDILRSYTKEGVQVVSPLTLSHKIEIIKAGVHAKKLTDEAKEVRNELSILGNKFGKIERKWSTFYGTHFKNAKKKADELDTAYSDLKQEFNRISDLSEDKIDD